MRSKLRPLSLVEDAPVEGDNLTPTRLSVVRGFLLRGWPHSRIVAELQEQWQCSANTVSRLIRRVERDFQRDYEESKPQIVGSLLAQMRDHYDRAMSAEDYQAAGKFFDRAIHMLGLAPKTPARVELTGANGGPVELTERVDLSKLSDAQLEALGAALGLVAAPSVPQLAEVQDAIMVEPSPAPPLDSQGAHGETTDD